MKLLYLHRASSVLLAVIALVYVSGAGGEEALKWIGGLASMTFALIATLLLWYAALQFGKQDAARWTWQLLALGTLAFAVAEGIYFVEENLLQFSEEELFPSIADAFWSVAYLFYLAGVLVMAVAYNRSGLPRPSFIRNSLPCLLLLGGLSIAMYQMVLRDILDDAELDVLSRALYWLYPVMDLLILMPVIWLALITRMLGEGAFSRPWRALVPGFFIMCMADLYYAWLDHQDAYQTGNYVDLMWDASYWLIGLSALFQIKLLKTVQGEQS
ncbi:MAG TPA: hypothetical protein VLB90_04795 [Pseudomonadales bacterium]|nr:hypothetical protein [Pseudomonadales bacterium]